MLGGSTPFHMMWSSQFDPKRPKVEKRVDMRRILAYFAPYWREEVLVLACIFVTSALGALPPYFTKLIIDGAIRHGDARELAIYVGLMIVSALASTGIGTWQGYLNALVGEGIMRDMRDALVRHLHRMPLSFFASTKTGEIMNRVSNDVDAVDSVVTGTLVTVIAMILTTLVAIFLLDWRLALLSLAVVPIMIVPLSPVGRAMFAIRKRTREQRDVIESLLQETLSLSGITLVKSFVREPQEAARFHDAGTKLMDLDIRLALVGRWFLAVGTIVAFVGYLARLYGPASALVGVQVQIVSAFAVFERIFDYLDMKVEAPQRAIALDLQDCRGDVEFDHVRFRYREERWALDDISLRVRSGEVAAIVGPSGAGKTTMLALLPRFYDPQEG